MFDAQQLDKHVRAAGKRDHNAFLAALELIHPVLWARALTHAADRAHAEDLLQETIMRAYEKLPELRDPSSFLSWMLTILDRLAERSGRAAARVRSLSEADEDELGSPDASAFLSLADEKAEHVRDAVAQLAPEDRALLAMRFAEGLAAPQIAERLRCSHGAVRVRLCRTIEKLRQMLGVKA